MHGKCESMFKRIGALKMQFLFLCVNVTVASVTVRSLLQHILEEVSDKLTVILRLASSTWLSTLTKV